MNAIGQLSEKTKLHTTAKSKRRLGRIKQQVQRLSVALLLGLLAFFISRASIFLEIVPLPVSAFLSLGGGFAPFFGALAGAYSVRATEHLWSLVCALVLKALFREEKWDVCTLVVSHSAVSGVFLWLIEPTPYEVILKVVTLIIALLGYFVLKKGYRAQFVKSAQLKFTKEEAYCSLFLLFALVCGIRSETWLSLLNVHDVLKFWLISMAGYYFGIGGGAATGAILGMLSGYGPEYAATLMSVYSLFGFFTGLFSKFSKFTAGLGLLFSYVFSVMYLPNGENLISYGDVALGGLIFLCIPSKLIRPYLARYRWDEPMRDVVGTVNSITANRLDKLAKSFSGLSAEISRTQKNIRSMTRVNENTLFDFVGERVCRRCSLKNSCWQEQYSRTADALTKAVGHLSRYGQLEEKHLAADFVKGCVYPEKIVQQCKSFYELYRLNAVWKHKLSENTGAFRQQFLELSSIICELKQNIEANRYFDAELSSALYSALGNEGYLVREAAVLRTASEHYIVKLELSPCKYHENCFSTLEKIIEDVLGVRVIRTEGGCGENLCRLLFTEGEAGSLEKRVQSISKRDKDPVGDSYIISEITRNQYLMALSDGMGSGEEASRVSTSVITLLDQMLKAGFSGESAYRMLNSFLIASSPEAGCSTLDFLLIDLKKMTGKFIKTGACPTYIKRGEEVISVENPSLPAGILPKKPYVKTMHLHPGDMIFMVSDGVMEALPEADWVYGVLKKNATDDITDAVDLVAGLAQRDFEAREDDITVLGVKVLSKP